jgi:cytoskeletal protein RodZ
MGEFGAKFRKARESKELSLDDVSNVTKISARMLQAIEEEDFDQLPGGVFNKGFIRAYAKHLSLNSEDAVNEYLDCLRQVQIDSHAGWDSGVRSDPRSAKAASGTPAKPTPQLDEPEEIEELPELQLPRAEDVRPARKEYLDEPRSGFPRTLIYAAAVVLVLVVILWMRHSRSSASAAKPVTPSVPAVVTPASAVTPATAKSTSATPQPASKPAVTKPTPPKAIVATQPSAAATQPPATNKPVASVPAPATSPATTPNQVTVEKKGDVTIRSFGTSTPKSAESSSAALTLVIRATENAWVSVTSDGQLVTQETLIAPANSTFHASHELVVRVGNAAGVSFLWNGKELPPQGAEAEAKTFIFDAQGMRASAADQTPH